MAGIVTVGFGLILAASLAQGVQICGLNNLQKCNPLDVPCNVNLDEALRAYSVTPQGQGYLLTSLDVVRRDQLCFDVDQDRVCLTNVTIHGFINSIYDSSSQAINSTQIAITDKYTHNVFVEADASSVMDLSTGQYSALDVAPVHVLIRNAQTTTNRTDTIIRRCNGNNYLLTTPGPTVCNSGTIQVLNGLVTVLNSTNLNDFGLAMVTRVATLGTNLIISNKKTLLSIVTYDTLLYYV